MSAMQTTKAVATLAGRQSAGRSVAASVRGGVSTSGPAVTLRQTANNTTIAKTGNGVVDVPSRGVAHKAGGPLKPQVPPPPPVDPVVAKNAAAAAAAASELPPKKKNNNLLIGAVLVGVAGASYYMTMYKMKDQDYLGDVEKEAEEAKVNLHKSGLKVSSKVKSEADAIASEAKRSAKSAGEKASSSANSAGEKATDSANSAGEKATDAAKSAGEYVTSSAKSAAQKATASAKSAGNKAADDFDKMAADAEKELASTAEKNLASGADKAHEVAERADKWGEPEKKKGWRKYIFFGPRT